MLATLVGLSMLLTLAGGIATLAGCLLSRRLRALQARRHPQQAAARERTRQTQRLAAEWPLLAQTLGLGYRDQWTRQHRFPAAEFVADDQGVTVKVAAIAGAGLVDYQRAAGYLADTWGCVAVRAELRAGLDLLPTWALEQKAAANRQLRPSCASGWRPASRWPACTGSRGWPGWSAKPRSWRT
jgi:hypothetical protein